jgi:hypothetical protein
MADEKKPIELKDPETAGKFTAATHADQIIHIPAGDKPGTGWRGPISEMPLSIAERYVAQGGNLLKAKSAEKAPAASTAVSK